MRKVDFGRAVTRVVCLEVTICCFTGEKGVLTTMSQVVLWRVAKPRQS